MRFPLVSLLVAAAWSVTPLRLQAQTPPPVDPKAVLATVKDLRAKQTGIITREKSGVLAAINAAIADPGKAYEQAVTAVEQQGPAVSEPKRPAETRPGGRPSSAREVDQTVEAHRRLNEQLRDRNFVDGLRLQLVYLSLTWQHGMGVKTRNLLPALLDYTAQIDKDYDNLSALDMFRRSLNESVFVTYFQAGPYISGLPDWSERPFDVEGIYEKTILPEMRRNKDPRLLDYWDSHLQSESARASASQNSLTVNKFNHIRRPSLLWGRAEDELALGNSNQAVADMLALLKANPDHPDFDKWATELEGVVSPKLDPAPAGDVTVGPAATVTPAPAAAR